MEDGTKIDQIVKKMKGLPSKRAGSAVQLEDHVPYYGIKTPDLRQFMREHKTAWLALPITERLKLAGQLFASHNLEQGVVATNILNISLDALTPNDLQTLSNFVEDFTSWATVDDFGINVLQPLLLKFPDETIQLIKTWNQSPNPWKRRSSMVAFVRKIGKTGKYTDLCLTLAENLLHDEHDLVLKGVGWALKDCMRGDQEKVLNYVKELRRRGITSVITLYAIRDIKGNKREDILNIKAKSL